ncbi:glycine betaine ABC transporter substrate-binding protein [Rhodococcus spongiicola]|uniref:glycine betaine ABC transporter substrate-binding protein n=1 Tax=Rhodococcus spongiicola TaxID=2487352 RepID=UPI001F25EDF3|nr:glycine betaine ABC transporter substrate-binding protein [Rhodococcus spongiicola]
MAPKRARRVGGLAARLTVLPVLALLAGCGVDTSSSVSAPTQPPPVVVGASTTVESELVARLYAGALEAAGRRTELVLGLGDRADRLEALDANRVSLVPDYTGRLLHWFEPGADVTAAEDVFEMLNKALPGDLAVSEYAPADDRSALVLPRPEADRLGARAIGDIAPDCAGLTLYTSEGFDEDELALSRVRSAYGCTFRAVVPVGPTDDVVRELLASPSPIGGATAAAAGVQDAGLVVLDDSEDAFTAQNVVPLYRSNVLRADDVNGLSVVLQLTTADLTEMVVSIRSGEISSADAASAWLDEHL